MAGERSTIVAPVVNDLRTIFGERLEAVVAYGWRTQGRVPTLALVRSLVIDDLHACAGRAAAWHRAGAAVPLLLTRTDFERSLDAFPIEYGEILANHDMVFGADPFAGLAINREDLRRACEVQVKSHLIHLREDFIEGGGRRSEVDALVRESAAGFVAVLRNLARLEEAPSASTADITAFARSRLHLDERTVGDLVALANAEGDSSVDAVHLFPVYLTVVERLAEFVDGWRAA